MVMVIQVEIEINTLMLMNGDTVMAIVTASVVIQTHFESNHNNIFQPISHLLAK